jgi:hypothetical protein
MRKRHPQYRLPREFGELLRQCCAGPALTRELEGEWREAVAHLDVEGIELTRDACLRSLVHTLSLSLDDMATHGDRRDQPKRVAMYQDMHDLAVALTDSLTKMAQSLGK